MNNKVILSVAEKPSVAKELAKIIGRNDNPRSRMGMKFTFLTFNIYLIKHINY